MAYIVERTKITVPHLAKAWGISTAKILAFIKSGELRAINAATTAERRPRYLIDLEDIKRFEARRVVVPVDAPPVQKVRRRTAAGVKQYF